MAAQTDFFYSMRRDIYLLSIGYDRIGVRMINKNVRIYANTPTHSGNLCGFLEVANQNGRHSGDKSIVGRLFTITWPESAIIRIE